MTDREQKRREILRKLLRDYGVIDIIKKKSWDGYYFDEALSALAELDKPMNNYET